MGSPSLLLMPSRAPVGSPGAPTSAALLWAQGRRTSGAEHYMAKMPGCALPDCVLQATLTEPQLWP